MTPATDRWGVPVSVVNETARELLEEGVVDLVRLGGDPLGRAQAALDREPGFPLAAVLWSYLDLYAMTANRWRAAAHRLAGPATGPGGSRREQLHRDAALAWSGGELERAQQILESVLVDHPRDLLALKVAQDLAFFLGDRLSLRDVVARARWSWPAGSPEAGYVAGMYAFGLEENTDYRGAEAAVATALEADPADVWAVHALAHVFEMEGRGEEGVEFLRGSAHHWEASFFAVHNWWHLALYHLELDDPPAALEVYDDTMSSRLGAGIWLDLLDAASLLWRLSLLGVELGDRPAALADAVSVLAPDSVSVFDDWHAVMAFGLAGRLDDARAVLARRARGADGTAARVLSMGGFDVLDGFVAYCAGRPARAAERLFAARPRCFLLGGSHAQRDVLDLTLLAAASAAGDRPFERALDEERAARKPSSRALVDRLLRANRPQPTAASR